MMIRFILDNQQQRYIKAIIINNMLALRVLIVLHLLGVNMLTAGWVLINSFSIGWYAKNYSLPQNIPTIQWRENVSFGWVGWVYKRAGAGIPEGRGRYTRGQKQVYHRAAAGISEGRGGCTRDWGQVYQRWNGYTRGQGGYQKWYTRGWGRYTSG